MNIETNPINRYSAYSLAIIGVIFALFQISTAAYTFVPNQVLRALHVGFLLLMGFGLCASALDSKKYSIKAIFWFAGLIGFSTGLYQWIEYEGLLIRSGDLIFQDELVGWALVILTFWCAKNLMGWGLPLVSGAFLLYCFFGQYLFSPLNHRGYDISQIIEQMSYGTEGIYGTPVNVSASYIFLFILFGTFLERAGMLKMFTDVALGIFGSLRGGAGKVSVFSSALMGTVSGSGVANVVTTGQLTIPMMKRFGFSSAFSGGVEAAASMGGQIMPPVMGAVSFIMAETLGVEYSVIVMAAIIPALAYFTSCYLMVHLEAGKHNLMGLPKAECPDAKKAFLTNWHLLVPLVLLVYLLLGGFTPLYAGVVSLAITTIIILLSDSVNKVSNKVLHLSIWLGLGALLSYSALAATSILMFLVALCIIINIFIDGGKKTLISCLNALHESAKTAVPVGIACALVGIIIGTMSLTGIGNTVGQLVLDVSDGNLLLSLVFVMLMSIVLGSGVPTIPNYIITSTLAAPVLENMGVPAIAAHMFCFYFGIMADLTPPVALAAFAAAPIAKESHFKISVQASKVGLGGYIVPFAFVYMPVLLMQVEGSIWSAMPEIVYSTVKMLIAMYLMCVAVVGFCKVKTNALERILALSASILFICTFAWSDLIALAFVSVFAFLHYNRANGILLVEGEKISNGA